MQTDDIQFHNVSALVPVEDGDGRELQRVPEAVRSGLNEGARSRMRHPAGVELRFVPEDSVELTLSVRPGGSADSETVRVFWGSIQGYDEFEIGAEPRTVEVSMPEKLTRLRPSAVSASAFDPRVCRICLPGEHRSGYTVYHGAEGARRPPTEAELPDRRYLAYGTSITEGEAVLGEHLTYVNQTAHRLDADLLNLGSCGTAYCDEAMADHIAARDDWDVATLSVSVNMVGTFSAETFRDRATYLVDTVAGAHPDKPVVCLTLFRNARDVVAGHEEADACEQFREVLRDVVAASPHENVHLLEGPELLPSVDGITTDLVHPGDLAMTTIAERLADELTPLLDQ
ncbi:SGNH/GDSL hydrolase family protein [Haloprofundus salilacus]|uniref:SGNH/GDSL hydrolase family protein n=1 Tax=Haloprofundus salilacus TaxID=2876190 RepID=UPI001CCDD0A2|nr:SGNH/GDSL hydrolase family protein [Haloprofundus salilacus]